MCTPPTGQYCFNNKCYSKYCIAYSIWSLWSQSWDFMRTLIKSGGRLQMNLFYHPFQNKQGPASQNVNNIRRRACFVRVVQNSMFFWGIMVTAWVHCRIARTISATNWQSGWVECVARTTHGIGGEPSTVGQSLSSYNPNIFCGCPVRKDTVYNNNRYCHTTTSFNTLLHMLACMFPELWTVYTIKLKIIMIQIYNII